MNLRLLSYLLPLIIGALITWAIIPHNENKQALLDQKKIIQEKIDSIELLIHRIREREAYWLIVNKERQDSFKVSLAKATNFRHKYENPTPVIHYSEPQLDSVIRAIIR